MAGPHLLVLQMTFSEYHKPKCGSLAWSSCVTCMKDSGLDPEENKIVNPLTTMVILSWMLLKMSGIEGPELESTVVWF